jgi:pimeloyl-ACP methyl ester carboxylesterase
MRLVALLTLAGALFAEDGQNLLRVDHYVRVRSTAPANMGQMTQIYVREVALGNVLRRRPAADRVVLFIHGAGTPAEVAFDVPYQDFSWMAFLAREGFDVFSMDMTGYGRSTRPLPMNDPCNLSAEQQKALIPGLLAAPCPPAYKEAITTMGSDWNDISAVVDYLLARRGVEKVNLIGWSQGAPRSGGYASQHPERVAKLILLAPAYNKTGASDPPTQPRANTVAFNTQSHDDFMANWVRQIGCPDQYDAGASDAVWSAMLESDPVGATWESGVRRAPQVPTWGWNAAVVGKMRNPLLVVAAAHDKQALPERVRELHSDYGGTQKVFVDLACSSHNALWEKNHLLLFRSSLEWLTKGTVNGSSQGVVRLGY